MAKLYPIGIQNFEKIRIDNYLYLDKTALIYQLVKTGSYYFLSRPRRFGKSLLISTLEAYFQGKKELFQGLAIENLEKDWIEYPVLHLDLNARKYDNEEALLQELNKYLEKWEQKYDSPYSDRAPEERFYWIIQKAFEKTGQRVVILVDEYDKPMLQAIGNEDLQDAYRNTLKAFYGVLKSLDGYIRFALLTGVTKFGKISVFSDLNNLNDISMDGRYVALCGIIQDELHSYFDKDIKQLAQKQKISINETYHELKERYDGYHFTYPSPDIYNPFSLLNAFADGKFNSYWFGSGTPTYLIKMLDKFGVEPSEIGNKLAAVEEFDAPTETMSSITPLLYQSGYVTIKDYDKELELYTLDIPNKEVRVGLMRSLLPYYVTNDTREATNMVAFISRDIRKGDMDAALRRLQTFLSTIPQCDHTKYEGHYQQVFYIIFSLLGYYVDVEVRTSRGRVDVVLRTEATLYVMELKLDKNATVAMEQINLKNYPERFALCGLPVVKVAVNFDSESGTLGDWMIEK